MFNNEFVINLPTKELLEQVWAVGTWSGRNVDKFQATGLTPIPADVVKPPRIAECPTHIECRIIDTLDTGDHTIFVGEVVAKSGDPDAMRDGPSTSALSLCSILGARNSSAVANELTSVGI